MKAGILFVLSLVLVLTSMFTVVYINESDDVIRGNVDYNLSYTYNLINDGPHNLTSVSIRLAQLKSWDIIQEVKNFTAHTQPNFTTSDEYENLFMWYTYDGFGVNRSVSLKFDVNLTLPIVDYSRYPLKIETSSEDELLKRYTIYDPLADGTDPNIQKTAASLWTNDDPINFIYNAYNFTSNYIKYKLLTNVRGASFALRNGYGDCDEYTTLFMALLRSQGIGAVEHTAWLADFAPGFVTTDEGAAAHAYPMFYIPGTGLLPVDPTRGARSVFDNWLKTDEKKITMTRGPDKAYRKLVYKWIPNENLSDPQIFSNYTIAVNEMNIQYTSKIRQAVIFTLFGIPIYFAIYSGFMGRIAKKKRDEKLKMILNP